MSDTSAKAAAAAAPKKKGSLQRHRTLIAYSFLLPNLIGFMIFTFVPIAFSLVLSLCDWGAGNTGIKFVGLDNFIQMFTQDKSFWISLKNTLYYTVVTVPVTLFISLLLAILVNKPIKGRTFFRSVFFFPYVASLVAVAVVWMALFNPDKGPVNSILIHVFHVSQVPEWLTSTSLCKIPIICVMIYSGIGYSLIVYLAALQNVPSELYDAAAVDGAGSIKTFWKITLPMVSPTTFYLCIVRLIASFKVFTAINVMGMSDTAPSIVIKIYQSAFQSYKFGIASAEAWILVFIILIITGIQFLAQKKWVVY